MSLVVPIDVEVAATLIANMIQCFLEAERNEVSSSAPDESVVQLPP
jgi:hypothetical protein